MTFLFDLPGFRARADRAALVCRAVSLSTLAVFALAAARPVDAKPPKRHKDALVKVETARLRKGPGSHHKPTGMLDAGRSARVIGKRDGWVKVRLGTGTEGWVRSDLLSVSKKASRDHDDAPARSKKSRKVAAVKSNKAAKKAKYVAAVSVKKAQKHNAAPVKAAKARFTPRYSVPKQAKTLVSRPVPTPAPQVSAVIERETPLLRPVSLRSAASALSEASRDTRQAAEAAARLARGEQDTNQVDLTSVPAATPSPAPINRASTRAERIVRTALSYRGTPYRHGATGRGAFDCSGFTLYLFGKEGEQLPRTAAEQFSRGQKIEKSALLPGDLVFFKNTYKHGVSHVGVYIGNGDFVHAAGTGRGVRVDTLSKQFYINHWAGARRPK